MAPIAHRLVLVLGALIGGCTFISDDELAARMDLDGDGIPRPEDCDDEDPGVGTDLDWYLDGDGDGFGAADSTTQGCSPPPGYVDDATDCDDRNGAVFPGADELCNGYDDDCDGGIDNAAIDPLTFHVDADGDGHGDPDQTVQACTAPEGYVTSSDDCDDNDTAVNPSAEEVCADSIDNDCDGRVDLRDWYRDRDGDGFGDPTDHREVCDAPVVYVSATGDCDDDEPEISPAAVEICDPEDIDEDCDGLADDLDDSVQNAQIWHLDGDGDGYGDPDQAAYYCDPPGGWIQDASDCDDGDMTINPSATEIWYDGLDQDCDDQDDYDADGDGYQALDWGSDCDDDDFYINPGALEGCGDAIDNDCDGEILGDCALAGEVELLAAEVKWMGDYHNQAGSCVAIDDFDGDGQVDVFLGAEGLDFSGSHTYEGGGYILHGPIPADGGVAEVDTVFRGTTPMGFAGSKCAAPGDLSGDGVVDLLVTGEIHGGIGQTLHLAEGPFSSTELLASASATVNLAHYDYAQAGDIDEDGQGDLWLSDRTAPTSGTGFGAVFLFHGPLSGDLGSSDADHLIEDSLENKGFGHAVVGNADLNGDGYPDLVVGAPNAEQTVSMEGCVYVYYDPLDAAAPTDADASIYGGETWDSVGADIANLGDADSDGYDDLIVGSNNHDANTGVVYLIRGPVTGVLTMVDADARLDGENTGDRAGYTVASAGDPNFDGLADIALTADLADSSSTVDVGAAYVVLSPIRGVFNLADADGKLVGDTMGEADPTIVLGAGDLGGDGFEDILVADPYYHPTSAPSSQGGFMLFFGGPAE